MPSRAIEMTPAIRRLAAVMAALLATLQLPACGSGSDEATAGKDASAQATSAPDEALMMLCGEARGALLELDWMLEGRKRLDVGTLGFDASMLGNLAQRVSAPAEVHKDVEQWRRALDAWSDGLRAMPPTITDGRLIEPDTSGLDRALVEELCPLGARLRSWHTRQCAG